MLCEKVRKIAEVVDTFRSGKIIIVRIIVPICTVLSYKKQACLSTITVVKELNSCIVGISYGDKMLVPVYI